MNTAPPAPSTTFSRYQKFVIAVLAFLQFTIILDFMIISPMGAILMPALNITTAQFGLVVSAYAFSAGIAGILAAGFADRFDRKKFLLFFYTGFLAGTLFCAMAQNYHFLLFARMITGIFGGVVGSVVMSITTDLFPMNMRGRVMGFIQTSFAASQVLGIPAGLYFSNLWGWHAPFYLIVGVGAAVGAVIFTSLKPVNEHLKLQTDHNAFSHLMGTLLTGRYHISFLVVSMLSIGGFMLMPFGSAFMVGNLRVGLSHLPFIYLVTGLAALVFGPLIGKASDTYGKYNVFVFGAIVSILTVLFYTRLGPSSLSTVVAVNVVMFVGIFSRMIPSQALNSAIPAPANRGAFMAICSSLQQMAGGVASMIAGYIVVQRADGGLEHFDTLGYIVATTAFVTIGLMYIVHLKVRAMLQTN